MNMSSEFAKENLKGSVHLDAAYQMVAALQPILCSSPTKYGCSSRLDDGSTNQPRGTKSST